MFTWNMQYISKSRLVETFNQLQLDCAKGDILIRIHTAIHLEKEAVDLAKFIKGLVPGVHIIGSSTKAVINKGKLLKNQCVISVSQMSGSKIQTSICNYKNEDDFLSGEELCKKVFSGIANEDTRLALCFVSADYPDCYSFVESANRLFPGLKLTGGTVNVSERVAGKLEDSGFVFDETGWTNEGVIAATISGKDFECRSSYVTGAQTIGEDLTITETMDNYILAVNNVKTMKVFGQGIGGELMEHTKLLKLFPYVYSEYPDIPFYVEIEDGKIKANHIVKDGSKFKRSYIYDRKIIDDNRILFNRIENFDKAETIFAYTSAIRSEIYQNCAKWELSPYENTNMCGCSTECEFVISKGKNSYGSCAFSVTVMGESSYVQQYNPYAFTYTDTLAQDNGELLDFLYATEEKLIRNNNTEAAKSIRSFISDCEVRVLTAEELDIPNGAALNMDMKLKGIDRVCMINVPDNVSLHAAFPDDLIDKTFKNYFGKLVKFAEARRFNVYQIRDWLFGIGVSSSMFGLSEFIEEMRLLQLELFEVNEDYIALVPIFCVLDDCTPENLMYSYYSAMMETTQKNLQFYIHDASSGLMNEENIRERYHIVNVINYAIAHDTVIPYYQGIHDNVNDTIHHYESLMRLVDETGKIYYPGTFFDVARSFGLLYDSISGIMIKKVFEKFKNIPDKSVSINLSYRDIMNKSLTGYIFDFLASVEHPENFVFEILESEDIENYDDMLAFVDKIHEFGGKISVDDFGSGYSNLQHIVRINLDYLKIDGSIVKRCCDDEQSANLIALISGWKRLSGKKMKIIAEFVENENIQNLLMDFNIDYSQGYLFSKPAPDLIEE
ncbi:MAG: EAL domain-containing protein [Lachnospiraceae bacterium]|nr:EAL domain-containing protein [Lachnospiraceae bacterium]